MTSNSDASPIALRKANRPRKAGTARQATAEIAAPEPAVPLFALNMDQISQALGCSVPTAYKLVSEGHLATFLVGRRRYASPRAVQECVGRLEKLGAVLPWESGGNNRTGPGKTAESATSSPPAEVS